MLHLGNQSVILILFPTKVRLGPRPSQGQSLSLRKAILRKMMMLVMNNKKKPYQILVLETLTRWNTTILGQSSNT